LSAVSGQAVILIIYFPDWSISFSTPLASNRRIYALYDIPLFRDSILIFFKTSGSNFNVTGVSFGRLNVSVLSSISAQYSDIECFSQKIISSSWVLKVGNFF